MAISNQFTELSLTETCDIDGGGWSDVFEKVNPLSVGKAIYHAGEDFGASGVKFGRECYDLYRDVKKIMKK